MHATRIIAIRHGETAWNVATRIQGQLDIELNARGRWQAAQVAQALRGEPLQAVYASDLARAWDTAQAIAQANMAGGGDAALGRASSPLPPAHQPAIAVSVPTARPARFRAAAAAMIRQLAHIFIPGAGLLRRHLPHKPDALSRLWRLTLLSLSPFLHSSQRTVPALAFLTPHPMQTPKALRARYNLSTASPPFA